jgi:hypothetical protein
VKLLTVAEEVALAAAVVEVQVLEEDHQVVMAYLEEEEVQILEETELQEEVLLP